MGEVKAGGACGWHSCPRKYSLPYTIMLGNELEAAFSKGAVAQGLAGHYSAVGD